MPYTLPRDQSYQEYLDDNQLHLEGNYRLLSTGEVIYRCPDALRHLLVELPAVL